MLLCTRVASALITTDSTLITDVPIHASSVAFIIGVVPIVTIPRKPTQAGPEAVGATTGTVPLVVVFGRIDWA